MSGQIRRIVSFLGFTGRANAAHTKPDSPDCRLDDVEKRNIMNNLRKIAAGSLAAVLAFSMAACGSSNASSDEMCIRDR